MQEVLVDEMDMHLEDMRRYSMLTAKERAGQSLPGAHLPLRGFYQLKALSKAQKQRMPSSSWLTFPRRWLRPSVGQDSTASSDLAQAQAGLVAPSNAQSEVTDEESTQGASPYHDTSQLSDTKTGQLPTPFADKSAAISINPEEFAAPTQTQPDVSDVQPEELARPSDPVTEVVNIKCGESVRLSSDLSDSISNMSSGFVRRSSEYSLLTPHKSRRLPDEVAALHSLHAPSVG